MHLSMVASRDNLGLRELLESSFSKRNLVPMPAGSPIPLLKDHVWLVVRGMTKLVTSYMSGDEALLGLVGPNEPFGEPLSSVTPYEAITLSESDLMISSSVVPCGTLERRPFFSLLMSEYCVAN